VVSLKSYLSVRIQVPAIQQLLVGKHRTSFRSLSMVKSNRGHCPLSVRTESGQVTPALKCHKIFVSGWRLCSLFVRFFDHKYTNRKRNTGFGDSITMWVEVSGFVFPRGEYQSLTLVLISSQGSNSFKGFQYILRKYPYNKLHSPSVRHAIHIGK
jgi:hypothetical protein